MIIGINSNNNRIRYQKIVIALVTAFTIFIVAIVVPKLFLKGTMHSVIVTQVLELTLSFVAIALLGRGRFREYGFCCPRELDKKSFIISIVLATILGAISSLAICLTGAGGHPMLKSLPLPMIILLVWFSSSIVEEIFTRGFLQGHLASFESITVFGPISLSAFISALFFGVMHLVLILTGADLMTIVIIVVFTFSLGILAADQRTRTFSVIPPIVVHIAGNMGGFMGGVVYVIINIMGTGEIPSL